MSSSPTPSTDTDRFAVAPRGVTPLGALRVPTWDRSLQSFFPRTLQEIGVVAPDEREVEALVAFPDAVGPTLAQRVRRAWIPRARRRAHRERLARRFHLVSARPLGELEQIRDALGLDHVVRPAEFDRLATLYIDVLEGTGSLRLGGRWTAMQEADFAREVASLLQTDVGRALLAALTYGPRRRTLFALPPRGLPEVPEGDDFVLVCPGRGLKLPGAEAREEWASLPSDVLLFNTLADAWLHERGRGLRPLTRRPEGRAAAELDARWSAARLRLGLENLYRVRRRSRLPRRDWAHASPRAVRRSLSRRRAELSALRAQATRDRSLTPAERSARARRAAACIDRIDRWMSTLQSAPVSSTLQTA